MSHTIFIHNKSSHDQEFEIHGWNNNQNMIVRANSTSTINANDGSSGAIIALHDNHEGEQAEITKNGFGGNDFFDISNIVGAGGNVTIEQVGDSSTLKGDPTFMQDLNKHWHEVDQNTRDSLSSVVHLDADGNVGRVDHIDGNTALENFARDAAGGYSYLGHGTWGGQPGNASDDAQSSAGHGNKDIMVTYNDGDARPDDAPGSGTAGMKTYTIAAGDTFWAISQRFGISLDQLTAANPGVDPSKLQIGQMINLISGGPGMSLFISFAAQNAQGDLDDGSPGVILSNKSGSDMTYFFYDNYWNGNGTAGANFDKPLKNVLISAGQTAFVSLPTTFKGRVQRGSLIPATWAEFQIQADNDQAAHGDISVEQGNDGGAIISSTDGRNSSAGFTGPINDWGGSDAWVTRADGARVLASTMGNWMGGPNQAAINAQQSIANVVYVTGGTGIPDVASSNKRLAVDFY